MNQSSAKLMVAVFDHAVCIKITGRADYTLSLDLKRLINELWQRGQRRFVLELCDCGMMDSTFVGTLLGIALKFRDDPNGHSPPLELFNPSARISEVLENLGIVDLFKTVQAPAPVAAEFRPWTRRECEQEGSHRRMSQGAQSVDGAEPGKRAEIQRRGAVSGRGPAPAGIVGREISGRLGLGGSGQARLGKRVRIQ